MPGFFAFTDSKHGSNSSNVTAADCTETCALPGPCNAPKLANATQKTLNSVLGLVTTALNHAWPEIVNRTGLDPFANAVHDLTYDLDHKDGCDEICGAQLASCHSFGLRLHSVDANCRSPRSCARKLTLATRPLNNVVFLAFRS